MRFASWPISMRSMAILGVIFVCGLWGCEKTSPSEKPEAPASKAGGDEGSCEAEAMAMAERLEPYAKNQPAVDVPFELPKTTGNPPPDGVTVLAGPTVVRVGDKAFDVPEDANPIEDGAYPDDLVSQVQQALVDASLQHQKEMKMLNQKGELEVSLGVHPDIVAAAVEPFFARIEQPRGVFVLAFDAEADELPDRPVVDEVEPKIQELEAAEDEAEIERLTKALEKRVAGECDIAYFRAMVGKKTGTSTMTRSDLLNRTPLAESVIACGCDEVDIDELEATLAWATRPVHPPVVSVPIAYDKAFGSAERPWSEVVAAEQK